jgi:hypothetical protein
VIMQDRPDLIQSELAGLAFDSLQEAFRATDIDRMYDSQALTPKVSFLIRFGCLILAFISAAIYIYLCFVPLFAAAYVTDEMILT